MNERGYSLVEILMAFAILAISVLPIMSMYPVIFKMNQGATNIEEASRVALTVVDYIKAKGYDNLMHVGKGAKEINFDITDVSDVSDFTQNSMTEKDYTLVYNNGGYTSSAFEKDFNYVDALGNPKGLFVLNSKGLALGNTKIAILLRKAKVELETVTGTWKPVYKDFIIGKVVIGWGDTIPNEPTNKERQFSTQFIVTPIEDD